MSVQNKKSINIAVISKSFNYSNILMEDDNICFRYFDSINETNFDCDIYVIHYDNDIIASLEQQTKNKPIILLIDKENIDKLNESIVEMADDIIYSPIHKKILRKKIMSCYNGADKINYQNQYLQKEAELNKWLEYSIGASMLMSYDGQKISLINANNAFYDELKCTRKDFEKWNDNLIDWLHPRSVLTFINFLDICKDEEKYFRVSLIARPLKENGEEIWLKAKCRYLYRIDNKNIFLIEIFNVTDYVKSEMDIKNRRDKMHSVLSRINVGVIVFELKEKIECKYYNYYLRYMLGYNEKEFYSIVKNNSFECIHSSNEFLSHIYNSLNTNDKTSVSVDLIKKDGTVIHTKIYLEIFEENNNRYLFITVIDTDKEKKEIINKENEIQNLSGIKDNLNTLYQISPNAIMKLVVKDESYEIASCNEAFKTLIEDGNNINNNLFAKFINRLSEKSLKLFYQNVKDTFSYKKHSEFEIKISNNNGRDIFFEAVFNRVRDVDNSFYLQCIFRDISEIKENEELSYYKFLRSVYIAIYEVNTYTDKSILKHYDQTTNIDWNTGVCTHQERVKHWLQHIVHEEDKKAFVEFMQNYMHTENVVESFNFRIYEKDGNIGVFRFMTVKMKNNTYLLCVENKTKEKAIEYKMRQLLIQSAVEIQKQYFLEISTAIAENNTIAVYAYDLHNDSMVIYTNMPHNACDKKEYDNFTEKLQKSNRLDDTAKLKFKEIMADSNNGNGSFDFYCYTSHKGKSLCNLVYRYVFDSTSNFVGVTGYIKEIQYDYDRKIIGDSLKDINFYNKNYTLFGSMYQRILNPKNFTKNLDLFMETLCKYYDISRVAIYLEEENKLSIKNIYEWANDGFDKKFKTIKNLRYPIECNGHYEKYFGPDNLWVLNSINTASDEIIDLFLQLDIMSSLQAIIFKNGKYAGFVAFYDCKKTHVWRLSEKECIAVIADIMSLYLETNTQNIIFESIMPQFKLEFMMDKDLRLHSTYDNVFCYSALKGNNNQCKNCPVHIKKQLYNNIDYYKIGYNGSECYVEYALKEDITEISAMTENIISCIDGMFVFYINIEKEILFIVNNFDENKIHSYVKIQDFLSEMEKSISRLNYKIIVEFYNKYIRKKNDGSITLMSEKHIEFKVNAFHLGNDNIMLTLLIKSVSETAILPYNSDSLNIQNIAIKALGLDYVVFDKENNIKYISDMDLRGLKNYPEFSKEIYNNYIHPDDRYKWNYFTDLLSHENEIIIRIKLHFGIYRWKKILYRKNNDNEYAILFKDVHEEINNKLLFQQNRIEIQSVGKSINCGFALYKIDKNIELLYLSPVLYKYFGYTDNDYSNNIIKNHVKEFAPVNALFNKESLFKLMEEGKINYYKKEFIRCDGQKFYADVNIVVSENGTENSVIFVTVNDNTEYYYNEQQFNSLISLKKTYFIRIKEENPTNIIPVSLCDIYDSGYNAELNLLLTSTDFYSLMNKENQNKFKKMIDFNCEENATINADIEISGLNNRAIYLRCNGQLIINEYKKKEYYIAMTDITDITNCLLNKETIEKEEDDFLNNSPFGAAIMSFDGENIETIKLNDNLLHIIGINKAINQSYEEALKMHPYDKKLFVTNLLENYNEITNNQFSVRLLNKDNNYISTTFIVKIHDAIDSKHLFINVIENTYIESLKNLLNNEQLKLNFIAEHSDCYIWQYDVTEKTLRCINYKNNPYFNDSYENIPYGLLESSHIDETTKQEILDLYFAMERGSDILHKNIVFHNGDNVAEYEFTFTAIYKKDAIIDAIGIGKLLK